MITIAVRFEHNVPLVNALLDERETHSRMFPRYWFLSGVILALTVCNDSDEAQSEAYEARRSDIRPARFQVAFDKGWAVGQALLG